MLSSFLSLLSVFFFVYFPQHGLVVSMPLLPTNKVITAASATKRDREIANLVALKAGKDINKQLYWARRGGSAASGHHFGCTRLEYRAAAARSA